MPSEPYTQIVINEVHSRIDWINGVYLPVLISLTAGLYAGLVASRMFAFFQVRTKAATWILGLKATLDPDYESPHELSIKLSDAAHGILLEVRGLGHERLTRCLASTWLAYITRLADLVQVAAPAGGLPDFPNKVQMLPLFAGRGREIFGRIVSNGTNEEYAFHFWKKLMADFRDFYGERFSRDLARVASSWPNVGPLITIWPFPNYLSARGDLIGLLTPRPPILRRLVWKVRRLLSRIIK
jgi:hypothetical protein